MERDLATANTSEDTRNRFAANELCTDAVRRQAAQILVVDDDALVRLIIRTMLEREGYCVQLATCGREALEMSERNTYDLVLTDISMADGDGIVLLERLHGEQPHVPVIMATVIRDINIVIDTMRRGAYDYLIKPFEPRHLISTVQCALDYRQALQENLSCQQIVQHLVRARTEMLCRAMEDVEHAYDVALEALGVALDLKDSETEAHSKRVTAYTIVLVRAMGFSPADIKVISRGALLHDIGKMAIPDNILRKPCELTPEERNVVREHCSLGYHILCKIPSISEVAEIVLTHHEQYDGRGYPCGLRGSEIPIGARILAVADTLDAITSDRPFRKARSFDDAREEIARCSGSQFDPSVVEVFLKIPHRFWDQLRLECTGETNGSRSKSS